MNGLSETRCREALAHFADELSAHDYLEKILWPDGVACPRCGGRGRLGKLSGKTIRLGTYKCYSCRRSFSITRGTLFASSHVPLHKWLQAIYLTGGGAGPIRPHHLSKILNVSFRTAAAMLRRLREGTVAARQASARSDAVATSRLAATIRKNNAIGIAA
jgi:transposase-like protein